MKTRIITAIILAIIFVPIFLIEKLTGVFEIVILLLSMFGTYEMLKLFDKDHKFNKAYQIITLLLSPVLFYAFISLFLDKTYLFKISNNTEILFFVIAFILLALTILLDSFDGVKISYSFLSLIYPSLGFASIFLVRYSGLEYLIFLFMITILTDVFAYFVGIKFGKHKLCVDISPKKTIEGSIGGSIIAVIITFFFAYFYKGGIFYISDVIILKIIAILAICILCSIVSQIGDLVASKFKRTKNVKDYSNLFPGHGGVLDRFDSSIFLAIFLFILMVVFAL